MVVWVCLQKLKSPCRGVLDLENTLLLLLIHSFKIYIFKFRSAYLYCLFLAVSMLQFAVLVVVKLLLFDCTDFLLTIC